MSVHSPTLYGKTASTHQLKVSLTYPLDLSDLSRLITSRFGTDTSCHSPTQRNAVSNEDARIDLNRGP